MRKFEVGMDYKDRNGRVRKCTKKTEKSIWFDRYRYELKTDSEGNEYTTEIIRVRNFQA